jgi:ribonucleotide reductase alpha subunit
MEIKIENINDENITFNLDKIKFNKISDINLINYKGKVYDLEIVDEPNYQTKIGIFHNGGGKRKGSFSAYIAPHHADIFDFLDLRKNNGKEELRCRDLNLALWVPDLFFKKVENDEDFYLMDPNVCKFLEDTYDETPEGGSFTNLYNKYVSEGKFVRKIKARELWSAMIISQIETGQPYVLAKDACNRKSNQNNLGTIKSSNLCAEIIEYSDPEETAVCFTADTKIQTRNGIKPIVECDGEEILCPFESDVKFKPTFLYEKAKLISNGIKRVYQIKTEGGENIRATGNHPFLIKHREYEWKKVDELLAGDLLVSFENKKEISRKILSIKYFAEREVYDLVLESRHNFLANNYLVHNCNLASVSLPSFVEGKKGKRTFNFVKLQEVVKTLTENLNKVIDVEYYPVETARKSNAKHRPIGIGIQGLADVFALMRLSWESPEALQLNADIAEAMYYSAMKTSCELAKKDGYYKSFPESPLSKGLFQFDLWNHKPSDKYDWEELRQDVIKYGARNSLLIAEMPTASCQLATNEIQTSNGNKSLYQIMNEQKVDWKKIESLDQQLSIPFNVPIKVQTKDGIKESPGIHYNGYKEIYDLEFEDGNIYSFTANHLLLVKNSTGTEWKKVCDLSVEDEIVSI